MADPTLKDVLDAIARLERSAASKSDLAKLESKIEKLESKMDSRFDELDRDFSKHMDVHRELEKDIATLKRRPPRTAARPTRRR